MYVSTRRYRYRLGLVVMLVIQSIFVEHGLRGWGSVASIASWPRSSWIGDLQFRSASADPSALGQDSVLKQTKLTTVNQYEVERGQATQGIAVDATYFYPISNKLVVNYDKATGQKKDSWKPEQAHQISHLNSTRCLKLKRSNQYSVIIVLQNS